MMNFASMMKQAQQMQTRMEEMQATLAALEMTGEAGAGLVQVTLTGKGDLKGIRIDPKLADPAEIEMLEDLVLAAHRAAKAKIDAASAAEMQKATGGLQLPPGMKLPF